MACDLRAVLYLGETEYMVRPQDSPCQVKPRVQRSWRGGNRAQWSPKIRLAVVPQSPELGSNAVSAPGGGDF